MHSFLILVRVLGLFLLAFNRKLRIQPNIIFNAKGRPLSGGGIHTGAMLSVRQKILLLPEYFLALQPLCPWASTAQIVKDWALEHP